MARESSGAGTTSGVEFDRRRFLEAGVAATAGLVTFPARRSGAGEYACPDYPAPDHTEPGQCVEKPASGDCPCPITAPQLRPYPLQENCEIVMSILWGVFADAVTDDVTKWRYDVFEIGRAYGRRGILTLLASLPPDLNLDDFVKTKRFKDEEQKWRDLGRDAGGKAKNQEITGDEFRDAWRKQYGDAPPDPSPVPGDPELEVTEVIGNHLWAMYAIGIKGKKGFSPDVVREGRARSRGFVHKNVKKCSVIQPDVGIDYRRWDFREVGCCAKATGKKAREKAQNAGKDEISKDQFSEAWCETSAFVFAFKTRREVLTSANGRASGCS